MINSLASHLGTTCVGILVGWAITRHYSNRTLMDIKRVISKKGLDTLSPVLKILESVNNEISSDVLTAMMDKAYEDRDRRLQEKAFFLGSLNKMNEQESSYVGYKELLNYSPELFRRHLEYVLAKLISIDNPVGSVFLFSAALNKLGEC